MSLERALGCGVRWMLKKWVGAGFSCWMDQVRAGSSIVTSMFRAFTLLTTRSIVAALIIASRFLLVPIHFLLVVHGQFPQTEPRSIYLYL